MDRSAAWAWSAYTSTPRATSAPRRSASRPRRRPVSSRRIAPPSGESTAPPAKPPPRAPHSRSPAGSPIRTLVARSLGHPPAGAHELPIHGAGIIDDLVKVFEVVEHIAHVALGEIRDGAHRRGADALRQGGIGLDQESIARDGVVAGGIHVGHVGEPHPETAVGHGVEDEIQRVLAEQVALVGAVALAVCDQLQLVLTGERRLLDLLGGESETNWRKAAGLQPKDAAGPQLDLKAAGVGGCR